MKKLALYLLLTLLIGLSSCKDPASDPDAKITVGPIDVTALNDDVTDVFKPLAIGNSWEYVYSIRRRDSTSYSNTDESFKTYDDPSAIFTETIVKDSIFNNYRWFETKFSGSIYPYFTSCLLNNKFKCNKKEGLYVSYLLDTNTILDSNLYLKNNYSIYSDYAFFSIIKNISTLREFVESGVTIKTGAGNFKNCYHFHDFVINDSTSMFYTPVIYDSYFCKGFGLVLVEQHNASYDKKGNLMDVYSKYELSNFHIYPPKTKR